MARTCTACTSSQRREIDAALVAGTSFRNIAERFGTSVGAIFRHKTHAAQAIVKASERRGEQIGDNLLDEMRRVQRKAWELLARTEADRDHRGSIVALREVRECIGSLGEMLLRAETSKASQGSNDRVARIIERKRRMEAEARKSGRCRLCGAYFGVLGERERLERLPTPASVEAAPDHAADAGNRCEEPRSSLPSPVPTVAEAPAPVPKPEPWRPRSYEWAGNDAWMLR